MTLTYWLDHTQTHIETHTQPTDYSIRPLKCSAKVLTAPFFGNEILPNTPFTRYRRLSNRLYNRFDNRLYRVNKHPTGCQTLWTTGLTTVLNEHSLFVQQCWTNTHCSFNRLYTGLTTGCIYDRAGCQTGGQTRLTTGWMFVSLYTMQPVVKPVWQLVWQPVWQQVVSCKRGLTDITVKYRGVPLSRYL